MRRRAAAALAAAGALLAGACTDGGPSGVPRPEDSGLDWTRCDRDPDAECAELSVPLDHAQPDGPHIVLALARLPARGERVGTLVTNPGGPGASGLDFLFTRPFDPELAERFDLVTWDPRGVGESTLVRCGDAVPDFLAQDPDPDDAAEAEALQEAAAAVAEECGREDAELLAHLDSDDMARDLEAVRTALGEASLDYFGFSYGTLIGQRYLDLFGDRVRTMVLDGVVDPAEGLTGLLTGQVEAIDATLRRIWADCTGDPDCPVEDPQASFERIGDRVERAPLPADQPVGPAEFATANLYATYDPSLWGPLMEAYAEAEAGDGAGLWELASGYYDLGGWTAYAGTMCVDSPHPDGAAEWAAFVEELTRLSAWAGPMAGNELLPCATWPVPPTRVDGPVVAPRAPPVLVVSTLGDAATPVDDARRVADTLTRATLVTLDDEGHTAYGRSSCVDDAIHAYLIDRRVPEDDLACPAGS